jgi:hypothetical protein
LLLFNLDPTLSPDQPLTPAAFFNFGFEISSLSLSDTSPTLAYVTLWDSPYYSFVILDLTTLKLLAKHSTSSIVERYAFKAFLKNLSMQDD